MFFFFFKSSKFGFDVRVDVVVDVFVIEDFRNFVVFLFIVCEDIVGMYVDIVDICIVIFFFDIMGKFVFFGVVFVIFFVVFYIFRDEGFESLVVYGSSNVDMSYDVCEVVIDVIVVVGVGFKFLVDMFGNQMFVSSVFDFLDIFGSVVRELQYFYFIRLKDCLQFSLYFGVEIFRLGNVDFVDDNEDKFVGEEGFDVFEEFDLVRY